MAQPDREPKPQFSQPVSQISAMLLVLGLSGAGVFLALPRVLPVFESNPYLNGFIVLVFFIGVLACFGQVFQLIGSVRWIERFASGEIRDSGNPPKLLVPLAALLRSHNARMQLNSSSTQSILDSVGTRIDEQREITRYLVNLLIFLGLLGTFYGLATTVPEMVKTIGNLAPKPGEDSIAVFERLMDGLQSQLGGMGVAFASSLLGLAGSLIVGLLELFAGRGQNRFYGELEGWLSNITKVSFSFGEEGTSDSNGVAAALNHMSHQMESLQEVFTASDVSRSIVDQRLGELVDVIGRMNTRLEQADTGGAALERIAAGQEQLIEVMREHGPGEGMDAESRMRLRSIDVQMLRILEEISAGRQESMIELRKDIDLVVKALSRPQGGLRQGRNRPRDDGGEG
ncbi:MAG: hypothetical protein ACI9BH_001641 [Paracoccaceae bacterium]|jgi:hypothetical protein